jgi:hypothetical protein
VPADLETRQRVDVAIVAAADLESSQAKNFWDRRTGIRRREPKDREVDDKPVGGATAN